MVTHLTLTQDLKTLGVQYCTLLMAHASLRKVGPIEGGADSLLNAIIDTLGPHGTLLMTLGNNEKIPFDPLISAAEEDIGILAEVFRCRAGTRVNDHAAARFGAIGAHSAELLDPIPLHDYYGPGSVLSRFTAMGGAVLRLGANTDTVTLTHWAEYLANIPNKRRVRRRYVRADIGEQWIESLDDSDGIVEWPNGDYFTQILIDFLSAGHAQMGSVGNCTAELFDAKIYVDFAVRWMENNL